MTIIVGLTSASSDAPYLKDLRQQPVETRQLARVLKKLLGFFDSVMLQLFDFERALIAQMVPFEPDAREAPARRLRANAANVLARRDLDWHLVDRRLIPTVMRNDRWFPSRIFANSEFLLPIE